MVMTVIGDVSAGLHWVNIIFFHFANDLLIGLDDIFADYDAGRLVSLAIELVPFALSNLRNGESCLWIHVQNAF